MYCTSHSKKYSNQKKKINTSQGYAINNSLTLLLHIEDWCEPCPWSTASALNCTFLQFSLRIKEVTPVIRNTGGVSVTAAKLKGDRLVPAVPASAVQVSEDQDFPPAVLISTPKIARVGAPAELHTG